MESLIFKVKYNTEMRVLSEKYDSYVLFFSKVCDKFSNYNITSLCFYYKIDKKEEKAFNNERSFKAFLSNSSLLKKISKGAAFITLFAKDAPIEKNLNEILQESLDEKLEKMKSEIINACTADLLQKQKETFDSEEKKGDIMHRDVLCRECQEFQFSGVRFMCVECQNYNLCQKCERKKPHNTEHLLIKFNKNMSDSEIDYEKYSCYFANIDENNGIKFEKETKEKAIYVDIVNDGKLSLVNCFIMSIGYKANYIDGKKTQVKNIDKGNKDRVKLILDNKPPGEYTSKWRVFLKNGYPIGNVLTFHVSIQ